MIVVGAIAGWMFDARATEHPNRRHEATGVLWPRSIVGEMRYLASFRNRAFSGMAHRSRGLC